MYDEITLRKIRRHYHTTWFVAISSFILLLLLTVGVCIYVVWFRTQYHIPLSENLPIPELCLGLGALIFCLLMSICLSTSIWAATLYNKAKQEGIENKLEWKRSANDSSYKS